MAPRFARILSPAMLLLAAIPAFGEYKIRENTPPALRTYLEKAIETGKNEQGKLIEQAKKDVAAAEAKLAEVRKQYRKMKAKDADLKAAEAELAAAKKQLAEVQAAPPLVLGSLTRFDQPGTFGTLSQGYGVSRIMDERSALIFPFVERTTGTAEDKVFKNNDEANKEIVPTATPLFLNNTDTSTFEQGQKRPADSVVYQLGTPRSVNGENYYVLQPIDLSHFLTKSK